MILPQPAVLGLRKSFGFGDRLGLATPGHLAAARKSDFVPIFAQQSIREMARTQRTPEEVMRSAQSALAQAGYTSPWGADADHLKTAEDVRRTAAAGFCYFTIDPSEVVNNHADAFAANELETVVAGLEAILSQPAFRSARRTGIAVHQGKTLPRRDQIRPGHRAERVDGRTRRQG